MHELSSLSETKNECHVNRIISIAVVGELKKLTIKMKREHKIKLNIDTTKSKKYI